LLGFGALRLTPTYLPADGACSFGGGVFLRIPTTSTAFRPQRPATIADF
jgi:hypothetical protein